MDINLEKLQQKAKVWIIAAGKILLKHQTKIKIVNRKTDYLDIATNADIASENYLKAQIHTLYPSHNIIAEESGEDIRKSDYTWYIDPLDGTKDFARGLTSYNISLALEYRGGIVLGFVYSPATDRLYSTSKDLGAYIHHKRMHVSQENSLKNSIVYIHLPTYKKSSEEINLTLNILKKLILNTNKVREAWEDSEVMCWLALGGLEGYILSMSGPAWWDVAPGILMVEEAGGKVTDLYGDPIKNHNLARGIVASNGKLHDKLLQLIQAL